MHTLVSDDGKIIFHHEKTSLLFNDQQTWIKRGSRLFDVTVGAYDGAVVCELVGNWKLFTYLSISLSIYLFIYLHIST